MKLEIYTHENCPACKAQTGLHGLLSKTYDVTFIDPTTDEGAERANARGVKSSPTILVIGADNEVKNWLTGVVRKDDVFKAIEEAERE